MIHFYFESLKNFRALEAGNGDVPEGLFTSLRHFQSAFFLSDRLRARILSDLLKARRKPLTKGGQNERSPIT
jgi:hypothetical protein